MATATPKKKARKHSKTDKTFGKSKILGILGMLSLLEWREHKELAEDKEDYNIR